MLATSLTTCAKDGLGGGLVFHASPQKIRFTVVLRSFFPPPLFTVVVAGASPALLNVCTTRSAPPVGGSRAIALPLRTPGTRTTPPPSLIFNLKPRFFF